MIEGLRIDRGQATMQKNVLFNLIRGTYLYALSLQIFKFTKIFTILESNTVPTVSTKIHNEDICKQMIDLCTQI